MTKQQFIRLTRPRTLTAAFSPVFLGSTFAITTFPLAHPTGLSILYSLLVLITVMSAQIAANIWNEYFDYKSGLDEGQMIGNSGSITRDGISPELIKNLGILFTIIPAIVGFSLASLTSLWLIPVGVLCIAISFLYSAGPMPLSRTPFGDLASGLAMGFAITLISSFVWSQTLSPLMLIPAIPSLLLISSILMANNLRDIENDFKHGRRTLAITLGRKKSISLLRWIFLLCFIWVILFSILGFTPLLSMLAIFAIIPASEAIVTMKRHFEVTCMDKAMGNVAKTVTLYHILWGLGILLTLLVKTF